MFNCVTLYNSSKKIFAIFEFLVKSKMAAILAAILHDITGPQQPHCL